MFAAGIGLCAVFPAGAVYPGHSPNFFLEDSLSGDSTVPGDSLNTPPPPPPEPEPTGPTSYEKSREPLYGMQDIHGSPLIDRLSRSPLYLGLPSNISRSVEMDDSLKYYTIYEQIGEDDFRPPTILTYEEFSRIRNAQLEQDYFRQISGNADESDPLGGERGLIPIIHLHPAFDRIFGGNFVDIRPNGFVTLNFGARWQRVQNPAIPITQQRNGGFEFDQQISMNVIGKVGEKLKLTANWDTKSSFDFENRVKLDYQGFEEDIIQDIEAGNIAFNPPSTLIQGSQNLMGVKTKLKFGKLDVTAVFSQQRGKTESVTVSSGGSQNTNFDVPVSDYEEDRHFFLAQYFRDNYEQWLQQIPNINSGVQITRVDVYITNRQQQTQNQRNIIAFTDLAEADPDKTLIQDNPAWGQGAFQRPPSSPADNGANTLYNTMNNDPQARNVSTATVEYMEGTYNLEVGVDYEFLKGARRLSPSEYSFHPKLGYVSINQSFQQDVVIAVAYEYVVNGVAYRVGELQDPNIQNSENMYLKLLRPASSPLLENPTWDLMMKNIYAMGASQISRTNFQMQIIYRDDQTGIDNPSLHEGQRTKDVPLVQLMGADNLNPNGDPGSDGNWDFVDQSTIETFEPILIDARRGRIIFPVLEPFGSHLESFFDPNNEGALINKYVFDTLYTGPRAIARLDADKNKFRLVGAYQGEAGSEINLPGFNISPGSVRVFAGSSALVEGQDYTVDYNLGRVLITNDGVLNSGSDLRIQYEKADLFNFQSRSLFGGRFDYKLNRDMNLGATVMQLNERPIITRVSVGDEPTKNTMVGVDYSVSKESQLITKIIDKVPLLSTKVPSTVDLNAEAAALFPGSHQRLGDGGNSFIDDFEGAEIPYDFTAVPVSWRLASTPLEIPGYNLPDRGAGFRRARMAWYTIDNVFYRSDGGGKPDNISDEQLENHYVRAVAFNEVFPGRQGQAVNFNEQTLDVAFYPDERGPYNYNPNTNELDPATGKFLPDEAKENWGGMTRAITFNNNFDAANIQYLEFWLMDPFISGENGRVATGTNGQEGTNNTTGGKLFFNLGDISEDVLNDGLYSFENGLPPVGTTQTSDWGEIPTISNITRAFDNDPGARNQQDIGMDGLNNAAEASFPNYQQYLVNLQNALTPDAFNYYVQDPSSDDFIYYLEDEYRVPDPSILERYKQFNGLEGNSPAQTNSTQFTPSNSPLPDEEDLNKNFNVDLQDRYFQYEMDLRPEQLNVGSGYIVDQVTNNINGDNVSWYLFRIPLRELNGITAKQVGPGGLTFNSIRWMRMFMTGWEQPVVLRMVDLQLVSALWRIDENEYYATDNGIELSNDVQSRMVVSTVNIEENGTVTPEDKAEKVPYMLPPGVNRDFDNTSQVSRQLNEQSLQVFVTDLEQGVGRPVFKNVVYDLLNYKKLRMYVHAHDPTGQTEDGDISAFIRIGTDFDQNYYEVEIPLKMTPMGLDVQYNPYNVWPEQNNFDVDLRELANAKTRRAEFNAQFDGDPYRDANSFEYQSGKYKIRVVGRPDMSDVLVVMMGVRNLFNEGEARQETKSAYVWFNELRVAEFIKNAGWAATARLNSKLADFATLSASGKYVTEGFGQISDKISDRSRQIERQYDIQSNMNLEKFVGEKAGVKIPFFVRYENTKIQPKFDPLDPDVRLKDKLEVIEATSGKEAAEEYDKKVSTRSEVKSFRFSNVSKTKTNPKAKSRIYDVENFSLSAGFSETKRSSSTVATYLKTNHNLGVGYNFSAKPLSIEPFKKSDALKNNWLKLIKDVNLTPVPSSYTVRWDLNRDYTKTQNRNENLETTNMPILYQKFFNFNRTYAVRWNLTKSISLNYNANVRAMIDEPDGEPNPGAYRDVVMSELRNLGRTVNFDQTVAANYALPLDKIPLLDWTSADLNYNVTYSWRAASREVANLGNSIQNNQNVSLNGKVDFRKLYHKSGFLKKVESPRRTRRRPTDNNRRNKNDTTQKKPPPELKGLKAVLKLLMMVKSANVNYSIRRGTFLPGYMPSVDILGFQREYTDPISGITSFYAPGMDFILGSQDPGIRQRAAENGWLTRDQNFFNQFSRSQTEAFSFRLTAEPVRSFRIQFDADRSRTDNYTELYRYNLGGLDTATGGYVPPGFSDGVGLQPNRTGSYSITVIAIGTSFSSLVPGRTNVTEVFQTFENNREPMLDRLNQLNPNGEGYQLNSQDVLLPAFMNAYLDRDINSVEPLPFPTIPLPNWRIDFSGLSNIPAIRKKFTSVNIKHAYSAKYQIANMVTSIDYINSDIDWLDFQDNYPWPSIKRSVDDTSYYIPVYNISAASLAEQFSPLIGVDFRTKSKMSGGIEYRTSRNATLNIDNAQVTEIKNQDIVINFGYTRAGMKLPFRVQGRPVVLQNDVTMRVQLTFRDTETLQRALEENGVVTGGSNTIQFRPTIEYVVNQRLSLQAYFERNVNTPKISTSFKNSNTSFGVQVRFSLAG